MAEVLGLVASVIQVAQVAQIVLTTCCRYIGKVRHAADDVNRTIQGVGQLVAILSDLKIVIESKNETERTRLKALMEPHGPLTLCEAAIKELETKLSPAAGPGRMTFREKLKWPFESKRITEILNTIEKQRSLLELVLVADTNAVGREINLSLEEMKLREEREKVLNWLRCGDPMVKHLDSRKLYQEGSNAWMLDSPNFKAWKDNSGEIFWIHAIAGAGKTILCSSIIEHMREMCKLDDTRIAFFYFGFNDATTQKLGHILRSLIVQLSEYNPNLSADLRHLYEKCDNGRKEPDDGSLASIFFNVLDEGPNSYLIIDALDEFPVGERKQLFDLITEHLRATQNKPSQYNILFTSRTELDIKNAIAKIRETTQVYDVPMSVNDIDADIRLYVRQFLNNQDNGTFRFLSPSLRKEIEEKLLLGASGMFRWVACQLSFIQKCKQAGAIRKVLNSLPKTLEETYDRILLSIPEETWQIARSALMLLTFSIRPITIQELAEGMVVDTVNQVFDPEEQRLIHYREVLEICSSLVTVSNVKYGAKAPWLTEKYQIEKKIVSQDDAEVVQLAHFSVKEYLTARRAETNTQISRFRFSKAVAHQSIAQVSLIYLMDFSGGIRLVEIDFDAFPFLAYAARSWIEHWRQGLNDGGAERAKQSGSNAILKRLFNIAEPNHYINVLNICDPDPSLGGSTFPRFDLDMLLDDLVSDLNAPSEDAYWRSKGKSLDSFPSPVYYAAQLGDPEILEWLMKIQKCDINATGGKFGQAIQVSSLLGLENIVKFLLENNANVNMVCGEFGSPLQAAAYAGHDSIVSLLLSHGADVNATGGKFGSALIAACYQGHLSIVKILLQQAADIDIICAEKGKALNIAAYTRNPELVQLLLKNGADINDPCGGEGTPLYAAAGNGDIETVRMLLRLGANINCVSGSKGSALQNACAGAIGPSQANEDPKSRIKLVKLLLEKGADVNLRGGVYGSALQASIEASSRVGAGPGDAEIVNLLIDHGADIHYHGGVYHSAIRAAVSCRNPQAARVLIEHGVELTDEVFVIAVERNQKDIIPLLLQRGVNVNAEHIRGTVLQSAINNNNLDIVKILLADPSLDVNIRGGYDGQTALFDAVRKRNIELAD
ncbi:hypothetical protein TWF696_006117 [Orbilia brochopaga]|uniref:Nephrocystin 3-like N-terminal domain-containing protein n=1 Tax=Orbilia brochopaga TaxID=3140254 RepID=A0AAV9UW50_9PEZI